MTDLTTLLDEHGRTFADELGIDVAKNTPAPLFELLVVAVLLATRINHALALSAWRELKKARLLTPDRLLAAPEEDVWGALERGRYLRKDRTTDLLQTAATFVSETYGGDLRGLRTAADGDADRAGELLQEVKGIGPTGAEIFLREVQVAWPELSPYLGPRALASAAKLGLSTSVAALTEHADAAVVGSALVRAGLAD